MFPELVLGGNNPEQAVKDAQYLLKGNNRFKQAYYTGAIDGFYGPGTAAGAYQAKYWTGYPDASIDHVFGPLLYSYLLPLTSAEAVRLPASYQTRRAARIAYQKYLDTTYRNPYRDVKNLAFAGYDQGVDFSGSGVVYAIGPAKVTMTSRSSGWPGGGAVGYTFTSGSRAGWAVYFVENIVPKVVPGQEVNSATVIATMANAYPYTEQGWAHPGTDTPIAPLYPDPHSPKQAGLDFGAFLKSLDVGGL